MDELIDALQCTSHFALYQDCYEKNCYANSGKGLYCNIPKLMADAADALEAADKRIARLEEDLKTREAEREVMQDTIKVCEKRIAELEAQIPKEGEWIPNSPFTGNCSECGGDGNLKDKYCSNCGSRMRKGEQE